MIPALRRVLLIAAIAFLPVSQSEATGQTGEPDVFIAEFGTSAIEQLTDGEASDEELNSRFRNLLSEGFDIPLISQFVAGRYWRAATEEERADFQSVFEDYLEQRFRPLFARYQGETFAATRVRIDEHHGVADRGNRMARSPRRRRLQDPGCARRRRVHGDHAA